MVNTRIHDADAGGVLTLGELLDAVLTPADAGLNVSTLCTDSREVRQGALFFARAGARHDARAFLGEAAASGAVAAVVQRGSRVSETRIPVIEVDDFDAALGQASGRLYGEPSKRLKLLGITGTNGKTTVAHLCSQVLHERGGCGVLGTLGAGTPGRLDASLHTTPELNTVNATLAGFVNAGFAHAVMEVSSHGIEQGRISGLQFDTAVLTNLSRDHLDYHGSMEAYAASKARLLRQPGLRSALINADDVRGEWFAAQAAAEVTLYSLKRAAGNDCQSGKLLDSSGTLRLALDGPLGKGVINSRLVGEFNAYNLLAAATALAGLGLPMEQVCTMLGQVEAAPGRMQWLGGNGQPLVVVDYSHTPDALEQALVALRARTGARLWCVFGCGGDRDPGKRPLMGAIAERLADHLVLTDDNPRGEASDEIIKEILTGVTEPQRVCVQPDRAHAISAAVSRAAFDDVVLVAGKGHEDYQERGGIRTAFSDVEVARAALTARSLTDE